MWMIWNNGSKIRGVLSEKISKFDCRQYKGPVIKAIRGCQKSGDIFYFFEGHQRNLARAPDGITLTLRH